MSLAFVVQMVLLGFYVALTALFAFEQNSWPLAFYYLGCLVKDGGVMFMGLVLAGRSA